MTKFTIYDENPDINFVGLNVIDPKGNVVGTITGAELKGNAYICSVACNDAQNEFWKLFLNSLERDPRALSYKGDKDDRQKEEEAGCSR